MSKIRVVRAQPLIVSASMSASLASVPIIAQYETAFGIQVEWSSSDAVGVISVDVSNIYDPITNPTGKFESLTFSPALAQPNSNTSGYVINIKELPFVWFKVSYTRSSGSGTLNVTTSQKAVGPK